ncbi:hypothetical protein Hanom_Chr13g01206871 [Helianthus anomalus]
MVKKMKLDEHFCFEVHVKRFFFSSYRTFIIYVMNLTRSELSNRPGIFYVQSYEIGLTKKVNAVKKISGSAHNTQQ